MNRKNIGFEINLKEGEKIVHIETSPELKEYFKKQNEKNHTYYIKKFLVSEKNFEIADNAMKKAMERALPKDRKEKCKFCLKLSEDEGDKLCQKYYLQMQMTYVLAATEFVNIVLQNRFIYDNKPNLQRLTINFFNCLKFIEGQGVMLFDLDKLCRFALDSGFLSISQVFSKSETLQSLRIINETLDDLEQQELQNNVLEKEDENYINLQKEFFEKKQRYYKEKLFLEKEELGKKAESKTEVVEQSKSDVIISIPKQVLYYYYLQATRYFPYFENHPSGKLAGIKDVLLNDGIKTTPKYFQITYNKIANHTTNRIAKNQESNISFVANHMLEDYPKAKDLALSELKQAQTKNR